MKQFDELRTLLETHNIPDDAFRLVAEIEADFCEAEEEVKDLTKQLKDSESELLDSEIKIDKLEDEIRALEDEKDDGEDKEKLLAFFADHSNWEGNTFTPQDRTFSIWSPDEMADKVLRGVKITA